MVKGGKANHPPLCKLKGFIYAMALSDYLLRGSVDGKGGNGNHPPIL
jgi:hypothetical protein